MVKVRRIFKGKESHYHVSLDAELVQYARALYPTFTLSAMLELALYVLIVNTIERLRITNNKNDSSRSSNNNNNNNEKKENSNSREERRGAEARRKKEGVVVDVVDDDDGSI
ncbi:MAG: hypothetical protein QXF17_05765 [Ignisphaera sp.]